MSEIKVILHRPQGDGEEGLRRELTAFRARKTLGRLARAGVAREELEAALEALRGGREAQP